MSKNIVMQQKTAEGYEELYPKADGDSSIIVNNTTNQFLGGGSTVGDALEYLSKFGMYWWKKVYQQPNYAIQYNQTANTYIIFNQYETYPNLPMYTPYSVDVNQHSLALYTSLNCNSSGTIYGEGAINVPLKITANTRSAGGNAKGYAGYAFQIDGSWTSRLPDNYYIQRSVGFLKINGSTNLTAPTELDINYGSSRSLLTTIVQQGYMANPYITSYTTTTTYICSSDPNAYPDQGNTDSSGAKYWKVGQPWEFLPKLGKVETGYYTGTGSGNTTLTFENQPQFVLIQSTSNDGGGMGTIVYPNSVYILEQGNSYYFRGVTYQGNTVKLSEGLNINSHPYYYFAITQ